MLFATKDKIIIKPILKEKLTTSGIIISTNKEPEYTNKGEVICFGSECNDLDNNETYSNNKGVLDKCTQFVYYYPGSGIRLEIDGELYFVLRYDELLGGVN